MRYNFMHSDVTGIGTLNTVESKSPKTITWFLALAPQVGGAGTQR